VRDIAGFLKGSFIKWTVERDSTGASWPRNSAIEVTVTEKHIRAWGSFLDSGADFLICFEDDAVFRDDSVPRIEKLLRLFAQGNLDARIYVDLAGGCKREELRIDDLESSQDAFFKFYSKPVTNTACAYVMSRELVIAFHSVLTRKPWLRLMGIDWMMNSLFIKI
jgi:GR25 family glycosyltransferase involved in LPS biosynthesis